MAGYTPVLSLASTAASIRKTGSGSATIISALANLDSECIRQNTLKVYSDLRVLRLCNYVDEVKHYDELATALVRRSTTEARRKT